MTSLSPDRKRIPIFVSFSGQGGVERMVNNLAMGFLRKGFEVDMVLARARGSHLDSIPDRVRQIRLGSRHTFSALPSLIFYLRREKPPALLVAKDRAIKTAVLACWLSGTQTAVVGRLGTTVSAALEGRGKLRRWLWFTGMKLFYKKLSRIVAVSQGVADDIHTITGIDLDRIPVVRNPVITPELQEMAKEPVSHPWLADNMVPVITAAGRLTRQKDFATLLHAFALLRNTMDCRLIILGDGSQRANLGSLASTLGIEGSMDLPGFKKNPFGWISRSSLFVLSSRWEGSPNTLTEALALGIPVVSTDCPSGPREILSEGSYGRLVPVGDARAMAEAMEATLRDPLPVNFLKEAVKEYYLEESVKGYLKALGFMGFEG